MISEVKSEFETMYGERLGQAVEKEHFMFEDWVRDCFYNHLHLPYLGHRSTGFSLAFANYAFGIEPSIEIEKDRDYKLFIWRGKKQIGQSYLEYCKSREDNL